MGHFPENRLSANDRGYTAEWTKQATRFKRAFPHCLGCAAVGRRVSTDVVDHTIPHKGDHKLFWNQANWQPSCRYHHDVIKQMLERKWEVGQASDRDLRLDSDMAKALTKKHPKVLPIGEDGWPVN